MTQLPIHIQEASNRARSERARGAISTGTSQAGSDQGKSCRNIWPCLPTYSIGIIRVRTVGFRSTYQSPPQVEVCSPIESSTRTEAKARLDISYTYTPPQGYRTPILTRRPCCKICPILFPLGATIHRSIHLSHSPFVCLSVC